MARYKLHYKKTFDDDTTLSDINTKFNEGFNCNNKKIYFTQAIDSKGNILNTNHDIDLRANNKGCLFLNTYKYGCQYFDTNEKKYKKFFHNTDSCNDNKHSDIFLYLSKYYVVMCVKCGDTRFMLKNNNFKTVAENAEQFKSFVKKKLEFVYNNIKTAFKCSPSELLDKYDMLATYLYSSFLVRKEFISCIYDKLTTKYASILQDQ